MKPPVIGLAFANERTEEGFLRNLSKEMKLILRAMDPVAQASKAYLHVMPATTAREIQNLFQNSWFEGRVNIFHYGGHATPSVLYLERDGGGNESFFSEGLARFLGVQKGINLVFLNACSTEKQALRLIEENIPAVIATSQDIPDDVAVMFAETFYKGLASGASIEEAFREADGFVLGSIGPNSIAGGATRGLYWDSEPGIGELDLPWKLFLKKEASWFPAQWRLVHQEKEVKEEKVVDSETNLVGQIVEKHLIHETLGHGTVGIVYRAQQIVDQEDRALKITYEIESGFQSFHQSMMNGFNALKKLAHPNIAKVLDMGALQSNASKQLFVSMELLKGKRLDGIDMKGDAGRVILLGIDICQGIHAAHEVRFHDVEGNEQIGIFHGNLMTKKIFLDSSDKARIIDFLFTNLARLPEVKLKRPLEAENALRTQRLTAYFPPEVLSGEQSVGLGADIYAIGAILLEVYTGKAIDEWQFKSEEDLYHQIKAQLGSVSNRLVTGIWKATHPNPTERWKTAGELHKYLVPGLGWWRKLRRRFSF